MRRHLSPKSWFARALNFGLRPDLGWQTVDEQDCRSPQQPRSKPQSAFIAEAVFRAGLPSADAPAPDHHRLTNSALEAYWS